ncbi:MAG TPA: hypothetical protein VMF89_31535, partial [Polyangiales bacterium]|nr:hypothetical protein [Polyangiales bacterium]
VGSVISSDGYTGNLRARRQAPDSEEALTKLAPQMGATLIVVLELSRNKLEVAFRNGHTGRVIDEESVPARGKRPKLAPPARRKLAIAAKRAIAKVGPAPSSSPAAPARSAPQQTSAATPTRAPSRPTAPVRPQPQPQPQPQAEEEEEEEEGESDAEEQAPAADEKPKAGADAGISFQLNVGGGLGSRSILVPTSPSRVGGNGIDTSFSPALDINAMLQFALGEKVLLRVGGAYRTLFAMNAAYFDPANMPAQSSLSSHSVVIGGSLGFLTNGPDSMGLHLFVGWAYRSLTAAVETLPSASVQGPALRPELHIPLGKVVSLRIAPELILVVGATAKLPANVPGLSQVGFGYGGEVTLDIRISKAFGLGIQFRESRALIASDWGTSATENERYITGRLNLQF